MKPVQSVRQSGDHELPPRHDVPPGGRSVFATFGERQVHFLEWGTRRDPVVVLLHGAGQTAYAFEFLAGELAKDHYVVAPDLPDHGDSDPFEDGRWTRQDLAAAISGLLDELRVEQAALVGASLGGITALTCAVVEPERVCALVLVDVGHRVEAAGRDRLVEFFLNTESFGSVEETATALTEFFGYARKVRPESLRRSLRQRNDGRWVWKHGLARRQLAIREAGGDLLTDEVTDPLLVDFDVDAAKLTCPVLVVRGEKSPVLTQEAAEELANLIKPGRLAVIANAGHLAINDNPVAALELISGFFREVGWSKQ
jgi:pimeloyl-ACP methyl ester carboxylesterase